MLSEAMKSDLAFLYMLLFFFTQIRILKVIFISYLCIVPLLPKTGLNARCRL